MGEKASYVLEEEPRGVAAALQLARAGNQNCNLLIWFSDNITNIDLRNEVDSFTSGAILLTREVGNPSEFGIAVQKNGEIVDVIEKPSEFVGNLAIGGIYIFDETFWQRLDSVQGDQNFSISDVTRQYLKEGIAKIINVGDNTWIDCGTPEGLVRAGKMVESARFQD